jgi:hypothetical protein
MRSRAHQLIDWFWLTSVFKHEVHSQHKFVLNLWRSFNSRYEFYKTRMSLWCFDIISKSVVTLIRVMITVTYLTIYITHCLYIMLFILCKCSCAVYSCVLSCALCVLYLLNQVVNVIGLRCVDVPVPFFTSVNFVNGKVYK